MDFRCPGKAGFRLRQRMVSANAVYLQVTARGYQENNMSRLLIIIYLVDKMIKKVFPWVKPTIHEPAGQGADVDAAVDTGIDAAAPAEPGTFDQLPIGLALGDGRQGNAELPGHTRGGRAASGTPRAPAKGRGGVQGRDLDTEREQDFPRQPAVEAAGKEQDRLGHARVMAFP